MDITLVSQFGFAAVLVVLWGAFLIFFISYVARCVRAANDEAGEEEWRKLRRRGIVLGVYLLFVVFYTNHESAYRPKVVINNPARQQLNAEMRKVDEAPTPEVSPATPMTPIGTAADAYKKNDASNAAAREAFQEMK